MCYNIITCNIILGYSHIFIQIKVIILLKRRYELKKNDPSKCRFCPDPLISKEYERELLEKFNIY